MTTLDSISIEGSRGDTPPPILPLYPFQRRFVDDPARLKLWLASRQIGKSTTSTADVVMDVIDRWSTPNDWNMMSRSQRQAKKLLEKAKRHALACNKFIVDVLRRPPIIDPRNIGSERLVFNNGAVIEAMPCDPDTTVGDTVNWLLDEFDLYPRQQEIFAIIRPSFSVHGKRVIVTSSPRRKDGKFHEIIDRFRRLGPRSGWSVHTTTMEDAIREGFHPVDETGRQQSFEQFKAQEVRDIGVEMWLQEYMCKFIDSLASYLGWGSITKCQSDRCGMDRTAEYLAGLGCELFVGVDVGRTSGRTVIWVLRRAGTGYVTEAALVMEECTFEFKEVLLKSVLGTRAVQRCCIDVTEGMGAALAERMDKVFPGIVDYVTFTNPVKIEMAGRLKALMESGELLIPSDEDVASDFASIQKSVTDAGNIRLAAPLTGLGHGDRFWAACLAAHAGATCEPFELVFAG